MQIEITDLPAMRIASVPHTGPYNQIGGAFRQLGETAGRAGLFHPGALMLGVYHDDTRMVPAEQLHSAAGVTVSRDAAVPPGLEELNLPAGRFAKVVHVGSYETLSNKWREFVDKELPRSGHERRAGAGLEIYRNTPETTPPEQLVTELYVPIV